MADEFRQKLKDIFVDALQQEPQNRPQFLDKICAGNEELRREVESLLDSFDHASSFMEKPVIGEVADLMSQNKTDKHGKSFGHYEILELIGTGGMGEVYLAKDKRLDRKVAIKILNEKFSRHESNLHRFIKEAKAASSLNHPNILIIHEINEENNNHYIVSEHIAGKTLREIISTSRLYLNDVLDISVQIANALVVAHQAYLVHRDIKPENIMIRPDGYVKILDFGLAKLVEQKNGSLLGFEQESTQQNQTAKGIILGTINYMSPEQAKGEPVDERTDIFSFGTVVYEMITGQTPFGGDSMSETFANLINAEPPLLAGLAANVPDELQRIVSKMLKKNKAERYLSMKDLWADLQAFKKRIEFETELERSSPPNKQSTINTEALEIQTTAIEIQNLSLNNLTENYLPIIGREREIAEIRDLFHRPDVRLVTITGIGGTGKTKLAKASARELLRYFKDGVFFVGLATLTNSELVTSTIAHALGVKETGGKPILEVLKDFLSEKQILLVVDNFEQVVNAAPQILELISAANGLKILITSRMRLHLSMEQEFILSPLDVPAEGTPISLEELSTCDAIKLFIERAQNVKPNFVLTIENGRSVAEICLQLDGLPLAIELAAARIKILSPQMILAKLENRLKLLTGGARDAPARQQTMRGTVAWSYDLLAEAEKILFRRLAVFAGGFTFEAAESVVSINEAVDETNDSPVLTGIEQFDVDILDGLTSLVEQSLLLSKEQSNGTIRFRMLEVVREYALETLKASGEMERLQSSHVDYFLRLGEEAEPELLASQSAEWLNRLEEEYNNLRAALTWSLDHKPERAARLAASLRNLWIFRCYVTEGRRWLEAALAQGEEGNNPSAVRFKMLNGLGILARFQGDYKRARQSHEEGLAVGKAAGDMRQVAQSIRNLGSVAHQQGDLKTARKFLEEGLAISRQVDDKSRIAESLNALGDLARVEGDNAAARPLFEESLAICREFGRKGSEASNLLNLGAIAYNEGHFSAAHSYFINCLATAQELGDKILVSCSIDGFAALAAKRGEPKEAARLAGAAEYLRETIGYEIESAERQFRNAYLLVLHTMLNQEEFKTAFEQGRKLKMQELIASINP